MVNSLFPIENKYQPTQSIRIPQQNRFVQINNSNHNQYQGTQSIRTPQQISQNTGQYQPTQSIRSNFQGGNIQNPNYFNQQQNFNKSRTIPMTINNDHQLNSSNHRSRPNNQNQLNNKDLKISEKVSNQQQNAQKANTFNNNQQEPQLKIDPNYPINQDWIRGIARKISQDWYDNQNQKKSNLNPTNNNVNTSSNNNAYVQMEQKPFMYNQNNPRTFNHSSIPQNFFQQPQMAQQVQPQMAQQVQPQMAQQVQPQMAQQVQQPQMAQQVQPQMTQQPYVNQMQSGENVMNSSWYRATKRSTRFDNIDLFEHGLLSQESKNRLESLNKLLELNGISYEDYFKIKKEIFLKEIN
ncbi:MAG: hypothetical protein ACRCXE_00180 [Metamycoplasmataceae bacterium]